MKGVQCQRCGSSIEFFDCDHQLGPQRGCDLCDGKGGWWVCLSGPEWCDANPLPGRENVKGSTLEEYDLARPQKAGGR
jgi:hypothetical protein